MFLSKFSNYLKNNKGVTGLEYGLITSLIAVGSLTAAENMGFQVSDTFDSVHGAVIGKPYTKTVAVTKFEEFMPVGSWNTLGNNANVGDGWNVTGGDVNLVNAALAPHAGKTSGNYVDLDGESAGSMTKSIPTVIGRQYQVTFTVSAPSYDDSSYNTSWTAEKPFSVKVAGTQTNFKASDTSKWVTQTVTFKATSTKTDVSFISQSQGIPGKVRTGAYISDIAVAKI